MTQDDLFRPKPRVLLHDDVIAELEKIKLAVASVDTSPRSPAPRQRVQTPDPSPDSANDLAKLCFVSNQAFPNHDFNVLGTCTRCGQSLK